MERIRFEKLNISDEIKKAVKDMGFEEASPIQTKSIPYLMDGKDVIGQAQTGTGKTAAFGIPTLERIDASNKTVQSLILCPTRELAIQVSEEIRRISKFIKGINILPVYGGQPINRQIKALKKGVHIVIGTPGRVMDHMRRGTLKMGNLKMVILDEADEMLNMGFIDDIETILQGTPKERQTVLFSATMPKGILKIANKYQKNPKKIKVVHKKLTVPSIEQYYFDIKQRDKLEVLTRLMDMYSPKLSLVFCNTKRKVDELVIKLQGRGYFADKLHGDMRQRQRDRVMNSFRNGNVEVLVATDVAARGIDVDDVEVVFNFDVPQDEEYYVHRIGRTGRAGRTGKAFTFAVGKEIYKLKDIQKYTKTKIRRQNPPSASDVEEAKSEIVLNQVKNIISKEKLTKEVNLIEKFIDEDYASIDIAAALLKLLTDRTDKNSDSPEADFGDTGAEPGMVRLFVNVGKKDKIRPGDIVGAIAGETGLKGELIGAVDIFDKYTFVEVPEDSGREVINVMNRNKIKGKNVNIEPANRK
ncbi:DEAD/DEAH box helicase [Dethiothermospora halolimnae]|uniref:DEAD/DEAH box helicase n=1 Tax=Dethiothermospora halolimnae TaxID=3114390 RepID=UPI003CCBEC20